MAEGDAPATLPAAITADGAATRNALRLAPRLFKVQLLDCFTGQPVGDARTARVEVTPQGDAALTAVWPLAGATRWDVERRYWLKSLPTANTALRDTVLIPVMLERGVPLPEEPGLKGAARAFAAWHADVRGEELPAAEQSGALDAKARGALLKEYNRCFYEAARALLELHGFAAADEGDAWGPSSQAAFERWQRVELDAKHPSKLWSASTKALAVALARSPRRYRTDGQGVLRVPIQLSAVLRGFELTLEFEDYATVIEAPMRPTRGSPLGVATVHWEPDGGSPVNGAAFTREGAGQSNADGPWGWKLYLRTPQGWVIEDRFRSFQRFDVPPAIEGRWPKAEATGPVAPPFSHLYLRDEDPELVLLAQTWCQPAWDEVKDAPDDALTTKDSYVPALEAARPLHRGRHLHVVTRADGLSGSEPDPYERTIGYGYLDPHTGIGNDEGRYRSGDGHGGIDVHAAVGAPVFAVAPGRASRANQTNTAGQLSGVGYYVQLHFDAKSLRDSRISYGHLDDDSRIAPGGSSRVKAGQILGFARRSGNLGAFGDNPGHTHLQMTKPSAVGIAAKRSTAALVAAMPEGLFPTHGHPHLFPCRCECFGGAAGVPPVGVPAAVVGCDFSAPRFTRSCWAVSRLVCPHIHEKPVGDVFRLQAQLRYLFKNPGRRAYAGGWRPPFSVSSDPASPWDSPRPDVDFVDLGSVDGRAALGTRTQAAIHAFLTIFGFHTQPMLPTVNYIPLMTPTALALLDHLAPVVVPR